MWIEVCVSDCRTSLSNVESYAFLAKDNRNIPLNPPLPGSIWQPRNQNTTIDLLGRPICHTLPDERRWWLFVRTPVNLQPHLSPTGCKAGCDYGGGFQSCIYEGRSCFRICTIYGTHLTYTYTYTVNVQLEISPMPKRMSMISNSRKVI